MPEVNDILSDPKVADLIENNRNVEDKIMEAAKILKEEKDPVAAVLESTRGLIDGKIYAFFSFKQQNEETARNLVEELRQLAAGKLEIIFSGDFPKDIPGADWNRKIREGIRNAHWFFLLLPEPSADWDWCLFETGMFRGRMVSDKVNKLICLHHPDQTRLPPQIKEFQAVKAVTDNLMGLLTNLFIDPNPIPGMDPLNEFAKNDIHRIAKKFAKAITPPSSELEVGHLQRRARIRIDDPKHLTKPDGLKNAKVVEVDKLTLAIFGKTPTSKPDTWGDLVKNVVKPDSDNRWLEELCTSISKAANEDAFDPIQATFKGIHGGKMWRPLLHSILKKAVSQKIDSFMILFIEDIGAGPRAHIPVQVQALMTTLKYAYRFRWELIERFKESIKEDEVEEFEEIIEQIETEALSRGSTDPEQLCKNFDKKTADEIEKMYAKWYNWRNDEKNGELDRAIKEKDVSKIQSIISDLAKMNQTFIKLTSDRLEQISLDS